MGVFTIWIGAKALAAQRKPPYSGDEALIGRRATARRSFTSDEIGSVFVLGEWWNAKLEQDDKDGDGAEGSTTASRVQKGEEVEIVGRQGYTLLIKPIDE
jgi:membrane protein implicated in regulation of membrane protease activity